MFEGKLERTARTPSTRYGRMKGDLEGDDGRLLASYLSFFETKSSEGLDETERNSGRSM